MGLWNRDETVHTLHCMKCGFTVIGRRSKVLRAMSKHRRQVHGGK